MKYISVFSGIEAASVAWEPLGWEPLAFCEIDEFPSAVLAHRFPDVENLGDITKVDWKEVIARHGRPDVVVGGSPCQSFSVAGGRESLSGESRLMFEYVRALDEIRPRWFLWENVPGVLNTRDNAFAQLLGEVQKLGYGSVSWRVLDAQFFGVAQRRRRVFLVGRIGEGGSAAAVLFEPESVRGDNPTSREKREALARAAGRGPAAGGGEGVASGFCGYASHTASSIGYQEELSPTLKGNDWQNQVPDVLQATAIRTANTGANGCGISEECAHTIDCAQPEAVAFTQSNVLKVRQGKVGGGQGPLVEREVTYTLAARQDQTILTDVGGISDDMAVTIHDGSKWVVRRLTPVECERLQGFPDGWTDIPYEGKEHPSDTPRYKAIGNSMAVPVMRWIGERIQMVDKILEGE